MRSRIFLIVLGLISFLWIVFLSFDLLKIESSPNYLSYFNELDKRIFVIHEWNEIDRNADNLVLPPSNEIVLNSLTTKIKSASFYVSTTRPIIVIEKKEGWNKANVRSLFKNGIYPFKQKGNRQFSFGKFQGEFAKNQLILFSDVLVSQSKIKFQVDRKATYSVISFLAGGIEVCDVYKKEQSTYYYRKTKIGSNHFRKLDDKRLFASFIPEKFNSYSFYDKHYLLKIDPVFKNSPYRNWISNELVFLRNNDQCVVIFDFKEGQSPIQNLNEQLNKSELNEEFASFENSSFSSFLSNDSETQMLYLAEIDGFCLVSHHKNFLDEVLTEIKLGHSLSQNEQKLTQIYGELPKKVTARIIDSIQRKVVSVIGQNSYEISYKKVDIPQVKEIVKDRDYFAMNPGEKVVDFATFNERGNVIALTESNKIVGYINGLRKWEKQLKGEAKIASLPYDRKFIGIFNNNECQLIDMYGKVHYRFISSETVIPVKFLQKTNEQFLVATSKNNFSIFDNQGRNLKQFSTQGRIKELAIQKMNNSKQVAMVLTDEMLYSVDLLNKKTIRKVQVDSLFSLVKDNNGIYAIKFFGDMISVINTEGKKTNQTLSSVSNLKVIPSLKSRFKMLSGKGNSITLMDHSVRKIWDIRLNINDLSQIYGYETNSGKMLYVVLDNIENELYLIDSNGKLIDETSKHGEQKVEISDFGSRGFCITTFLGNYLIQYNKLDQ